MYTDWARNCFTNKASDQKWHKNNQNSVLYPFILPSVIEQNFSGGRGVLSKGNRRRKGLTPYSQPIGPNPNRNTSPVATLDEKKSLENMELHHVC